MSNTISNGDFISVLNETLHRGKDFSFCPGGSSMKPMLNGTTDKVVLAKKPDRLSKYDVALYVRRSDNSLVLHRVVKVTDNSYTMSGDNQYYFDYDIPHSDVLAVMKSFTHNSKVYKTTSCGYRLYSKIILFKKYFRNFISKIYHKIFK